MAFFYSYLLSNHNINRPKMIEKTIYRSAEGKAKIIALYDDFITQLGIEHEDINVETRYGSTHVLAIGPVEAPPLIFFHGGNSLNPFELTKKAILFM